MKKTTNVRNVWVTIRFAKEFAEEKKNITVKIVASGGKLTELGKKLTGVN